MNTVTGARDQFELNQIMKAQMWFINTAEMLNFVSHRTMVSQYSDYNYTHTLDRVGT